MIINLYTIRNYLIQGKKLVDLPLRVTYYARVSTNHEEQLNSLENQVMYLFFPKSPDSNYLSAENNSKNSGKDILTH